MERDVSLKMIGVVKIENTRKNEAHPVVVLAAGGKGTRIQSLNSEVPKPMIPIAGKPILQWEIESLVQQGYKEFIITVSHMGQKIIEYFGDGEAFGCRIEYFIEKEPLGNAGALYKLWSDHRLTDTFLFLIADAIFDFDVGRFLAYHREKKALATLFFHPNSHPYDSSLLVIGDDGRVGQWINKEDERPPYYKNSVNAGLQILTTELLERSGIDPKTVSHERKVDLDRDVLKPAIPSGRIFGYHSTEFCKDAGTPERFHAVEADIKSGSVQKRNLKNKQRAVFLDRDGTINKYVGFLRDIAQFELIDGVAEAVHRVNDSGYLSIVVTNQPVIARGEVTDEQLATIHNKMETLLGKGGAYIDALYYCPHHPDKGFDGEIPELKIDCDCRKPKPGMLLKAAKDFNIDLSNSWLIGDGERDIKAGINAGCKTVLLSSDNGESRDSDFGQNLTAHSLLEAVEMILVDL